MSNHQSCLQLFKHDADSILPDSNMFCFRKTQEHLNVFLVVFH